jgi:hypothetical protein
LIRAISHDELELFLKIWSPWATAQDLKSWQKSRARRSRNVIRFGETPLETWMKSWKVYSHLSLSLSRQLFAKVLRLETSRNLVQETGFFVLVHNRKPWQTLATGGWTLAAYAFLSCATSWNFEILIEIVGGLKHEAISLFPVAIFELRVDLN